PDVPVIVVTAHGRIDSAVEAMKAGAFDFLAKPFDHQDLKGIIAKASRQSDYNQRNVVPEERPEGSVRRYTEIVGKGPRMQELQQVIAKVSDAPSTVLIQGESGTGKELVATALHETSVRRDRPFIKINCAAIPRELVEAELFGFEKGAFTGAVQSKPGRFELADGGTLFLDEIGEIPMEMQVKLLRAIQESEFERVGGVKTTKVEVRLVAATSRDLGKEIAAGRFREDLYYRLNVVPIYLPPLRERREDIPSLVEFFLKRYADQNRREVRRVHPEAMRLLREHDWPGNVRELQNYVERAVILGEGHELTVEHLPPQLRGVAAPRPIRSRGGGLAAMTADLVRQGVRAAGPHANDLHKRIVDQVERELIQQVLQSCERVQIKAAARLGINRNTLHKKLAQYRIDGDENGQGGAAGHGGGGNSNSNSNGNGDGHDETGPPGGDEE